MTTSIANRALAFILAAIVALVVFGLFAVAMQTGVGMMILLVLCAGALSAIMLVAFRGFTATRLTWQIESNRHDEAVLKLGHDPETYQLIERQAQLPAPVQAVEVKPVDPRREHALRLLTATLDSDAKDKQGALKYGPKSVKVMTQADAGAVGMIADDWSAAVSYLFLFGVATGNTGTIIKDQRNVSRLMSDVARDRQDNEASAVMGLPERKR